MRTQQDFVSLKEIRVIKLILVLHASEKRKKRIQLNAVQLT